MFQIREGIIAVLNANNELIPMKLVIGLRVCMDYRKLYASTEKDHFLMTSKDHMLDRLAEKEWYSFLNSIQAIIRSSLL